MWARIVEISTKTQGEEASNVKTTTLSVVIVVRRSLNWYKLKGAVWNRLINSECTASVTFHPCLEESNIEIQYGSDIWRGTWKIATPVGNVLHGREMDRDSSELGRPHVLLRFPVRRRQDGDRAEDDGKRVEGLHCVGTQEVHDPTEIKDSRHAVSEVCGSAEPDLLQSWPNAPGLQTHDIFPWEFWMQKPRRLQDEKEQLASRWVARTDDVCSRDGQTSPYPVGFTEIARTRLKYWGLVRSPVPFKVQAPTIQFWEVLVMMIFFAVRLWGWPEARNKPGILIVSVSLLEVSLKSGIGGSVTRIETESIRETEMGAWFAFKIARVAPAHPNGSRDWETFEVMDESMNELYKSADDVWENALARNTSHCMFINQVEPPSRIVISDKVDGPKTVVSALSHLMGEILILAWNSEVGLSNAEIDLSVLGEGELKLESCKGI